MKLNTQHPAGKITAAIAIALAATIFVFGIAHAPGLSLPIRWLDDVAYDAMYRTRPLEDQTGRDVVIVAVDQKSLDAMYNQLSVGWPWPRKYWGQIVTYLGNAGAKAVAFDVLFTEQSVYGDKDDEAFALAVDTTAAKTKMPVIVPAVISKPDQDKALAVPIGDPIFGIVNAAAQDQGVQRAYEPVIFNNPSLAWQAVRSAGFKSNLPDAPFRLHYYGPHAEEVAGNPRYTFRYITAASVIAASQPNAAPDATLPTAADFRGKIVLIGTIAAGTFDLKSTPLSSQYPGVEINATAIQNLIDGQQVSQVGAATAAAAAFVAALLVSLGAILPRRIWVKTMLGVVVAGGIIACAIGLFRMPHILWMPVAAPLMAVAVSMVGGLSWSYVSEDRQRRYILKALSQYVSPAVAEALAKDPSKLSIGGVRREMTVMFTDIAGFTDLSETLEAEQLATLLNYYLDEMSAVVIKEDGTLDKYVGDAIVSFWNAPVAQEDHAMRACAAALQMQEREAKIQPELKKLGAEKMHTRIGINSGVMAVGNMGSSKKFNYSVLGDSVNLAARLEGANKFYGTRILIAEGTASLVRQKFLLRKVDVLRVKGKKHPMAVFELMGVSADAGHGSGLPVCDPRLAQLAAAYEEAFSLYQRQQWDAADAVLQQILQGHPKDGPASTLLARIAVFRAAAPTQDWDGVYVATQK
jgi:adenylate cyclase